MLALGIEGSANKIGVGIVNDQGTGREEEGRRKEEEGGRGRERKRRKGKGGREDEGGREGVVSLEKCKMEECPTLDLY